MRATLALAVGILAAGCGGSDGLSVSLGDVDPTGELWAIQAVCEGGHFGVEFVPGKRLSLPEIGHASYEDISVECGKPERIAISTEEGAPVPADMTEPTYKAARLACFADGTLVVEVNPIWGDRSIVGASLSVERGGQAILAGSLKRDEYDGTDWSRVSWSRSICSPA